MELAKNLLLRIKVPVPLNPILIYFLTTKITIIFYRNTKLQGACPFIRKDHLPSVIK